jgi:hypothetical protein
MTAEVAILNREAVAMAADSALTLGVPVGKVYNSANKLFALSRLDPVAVMVYGGGSFEGIPWATVVKEYRRRLATGAFDTIDDYASDFMAFLSSLAHRMPAELQRERVLMRVSGELHGLRKAVEAETSGDHSGNNQAIDHILMDRIEARIRRLEAEGGENGLGEPSAAQAFDDAVANWDALIGDILQSYRVTDTVKTRARAMVCASLRVATWSPASSGVVVAGFGTSQLFPALSHHLVDGLLVDRVRVRQIQAVQIGWQQSAVICPFAQQDMVQTFMDGLHPDYPQALVGFVDEMMRLFADHFGDQVQDALSADEYEGLAGRMAVARSETVERFQEQMRDLLEKQHSGSIMSVVSMLPKEELAEMAEALVNLTSMKRRVTPKDETVGGPVDVAVISKGDGFVWIKRKHYFSPEMNHRFFDRDQDLLSGQTGGQA